MKPILFNTEMVRAILAGRKTETRRVVKPQPKGRLVPEHPASCWPGYFGEADTPRVMRPPYFIGDILYVRETWHKDAGRYMYKANYTDNEKFYVNGREVSIKWHPSIHMPKEAARMFLRVKDVRVERLQDITPEQIDAEGCKEWAYNANTGELLPSGPIWFRILWDSTIKPADRALYGWTANPWVWVIEFERVTKEEAEDG